MAAKTTLAALATLLVACSSSNTSGVKVATGKSAVQGKNACEVLTLADAQEIYGSDMKKSERNRAFSGPGADVSTCTYQNDRTPLSIATG